jgi:hypothetical protein
MQRRRAIYLRSVYIGLPLQQGAHGGDVLIHCRIRDLTDHGANAAG